MQAESRNKQKIATPWQLYMTITLIKKNKKFFSYIRKSRRERLQSHIWIWLMASSYMTKYLCISSFIRKPFLIYDFATAPIWISLYMRKILFSFLSVPDTLLLTIMIHDILNYDTWRGFPDFVLNYFLAGPSRLNNLCSHQIYRATDSIAIKLVKTGNLTAVLIDLQFCNFHYPTYDLLSWLRATLY